MTSEAAHLAALSRIHPENGFGIGDDTALLPEGLLATIDTLVEGVHFTSTATPEELACKLIGVNLSDIAAMGGRPLYALLSLATAPGFDTTRFQECLTELAKTYDMIVVGGDTVATETTTLTLTVLGRSPAQPARRHLAVAGETVFVTGPLGGAVTSGRHLRPVPRLDEGCWLVEQGVRCLMDLSDGLGSGAHTLAKESGVSVLLDALSVPCHDVTAGASPEDRLQAALFDGEDFELLGTVSTKKWSRLKLGAWPLIAIGQVETGDGVWLRHGEERVAVPLQGWEHNW